MSSKRYCDLSKRRKRDYVNSIKTTNNNPHKNNNDNPIENPPINQRNINNNIMEDENNSADEDGNNLDGGPQFHIGADIRQYGTNHQNNIENQVRYQPINQRVAVNRNDVNVDDEDPNPENVHEQAEEITLPNENVRLAQDHNRDVRGNEENIGLNVYEEEEEEEEEEVEQIFVDEEEEEENPRENNNFNYDLPLYNGAPLTISQSMLLIATLLITHNITQSCLIDILSIVNLHCLNDELHKNSLFKFKKFFALGNNNFTNYKKHYYCSNCLKGVPSFNYACPECLNNKTSHFITLSIVEQLQEMYKRVEFYQKLQHRFRQPNLNPNTIIDVYDGCLYKNLVRNGYLSNPNNISFMWYTDGVPVFKSSHISIWPLYLTVNELPFKDRTKRHNLILAGLWFGDTKPDANLFIDKLHCQLTKLFEGENYVLSDGQEIRVQAALLFGTCDNPAKTHFLNFKQFNGFYGCPACLEPGESFRCSTGGTTHVYKYTENPTMRTSEQSREHGNIALLNNKEHLGVKGPCALSNLMPDFIAGTAIDKMHCIDSGVVKKLLTLWFDCTYNSFRYSLYPVIQVINDRLIGIKPPKFVHRMPRTIQELTHWKASELRMWFFYYSLPVLSGIMQNIYFEHFMLLVTGIAYLNADSISHEMINTAQRLLNKFVCDFETLYGLQYCSINVHSLLHLPEFVRRIGPLWSTSCYQFEDLNGQFLKLIHGTRHIDSQIASIHGQLLRMQQYQEQLPDGPLRDFCFIRKYGVKICEKLSRRCYSVGTYIFFDDFPQYLHTAVRHLLPIRNIRKYYRLLKDGKLYISELYTRDLQTLSSDIQYTDHAGISCFGRIHCFIKITNCECLNACHCHGTHYAIIKNFEFNNTFQVRTDHDNVLVPYMYEFRITEDYIAVPVQFLNSVCVSMKIDNSLFIATPVNTKELE